MPFGSLEFQDRQWHQSSFVKKMVDVVNELYIKPWVVMMNSNTIVSQVVEYLIA